eukprot:TRINITY_DN15822_c0_g1_i1.p1 TRINITY_DN15822_c0_g1~~TRINITY_DN15822_c0_g1_i1.p1  ORF type:complete len:550 (-),score=86.02 TRINITY_DN15822_c0_g1_i1:377-1819(-)
MPSLPFGDGGAVVTIHGTMWQKRTAGRRLVDILFERQGVDPARWASGSGCLTVVLPAKAREVVESKQIHDSVSDVGARIHVRPDPPETALGVKVMASRLVVEYSGNAQQAVSAATRVNAALQDLVDHGVLVHMDFAEESPALAPHPGVNSDGATVSRSQPLPPPSVAEAVRSARLSPAAGVATQPPHSANVSQVQPLGPSQRSAVVESPSRASGEFEGVRGSGLRNTPLTAASTEATLPSEPTKAGHAHVVPGAAGRDGDDNKGTDCNSVGYSTATPPEALERAAQPASVAPLEAFGSPTKPLHASQQLLPIGGGGGSLLPSPDVKALSAKQIDGAQRPQENGEATARSACGPSLGCGFSGDGGFSGSSDLGCGNGGCAVRGMAGSWSGPNGFAAWRCGAVYPGALGPSTLSLLLPGHVIDTTLVPRGHLAEVAQRCGVRIDVGPVAVAPDARAVMLTGTVVANALAVLQLQWRLAQCAC